MKNLTKFTGILLLLSLCSSAFAQTLPDFGGGGCTNCPPPTNYFTPRPYVPGLKMAILHPGGTNLFINLLEADPAGTYDLFSGSNLTSSTWSDVLGGTNGQTNFTLTFTQANMGFFRAARTDAPVTNTAGMTISFPNLFVNTNLIMASVDGGPAAAMAVLVNDTNLADAVWIPFSAVPYVLLETNDGIYQVEFGFIGSDGQTNWTSASVTLDTTPPVLIITSPTNDIVTQPIIQLQGYSPEALSGISYDMTNAAGLTTNQQVLVLDQFYDTNTFKFTTNTFQGFDIPLTNGLNTITLHATDLAGNTKMTNFSFTLDYSSKTNPPLIQLNWPQDGMKVCGSNILWTGSISDPTATVVAQAVDGGGNTNIINGAVGRDGNFWVQNVPLSGGTNTLTLTVTDVAGNITTTNITVFQGDAGLVINPVSASTTTVTGTINSTNFTVWVNGIKATLSGNTWTANFVPIAPQRLVQVTAIPNSDNGGYGSWTNNGGGQ